MDHKQNNQVELESKQIVNSTVFIILSLRHILKGFNIDPKKIKIIAANVTKCPT